VVGGATHHKSNITDDARKHRKNADTLCSVNQEAYIAPYLRKGKNFM